MHPSVFAGCSVRIVCGRQVSGQDPRRVDRRFPGVHPPQAAPLLVITAIGFCPHPVAARSHLPHDPRGRPACRQSEPDRPGENAGRHPPRHRVGDYRADLRIAVLDTLGVNLAPLLASPG